MESFLKKVITNKVDEDSRKYFLRFGKGNYSRRFLISCQKGKKIKIRGSFEWANDFVRFVDENKDMKFSGKILSKEKVVGKEGKKKAGTFVYEVTECSLDEFANPYFYLLNCNDDEMVLKIKKNLPKPGKNAEKIDNKFCALDVNDKYWDKVKEVFFWDIPECKKVIIEHEVVFESVIMPEKEDGDVRELAKRKGKIIRKINCDGKEIINKYNVLI